MTDVVGIIIIVDASDDGPHPPRIIRLVHALLTEGYGVVPTFSPCETVLQVGEVFQLPGLVDVFISIVYS